VILTEALLNDAIKDVTRVECIDGAGGRAFTRWDLRKMEVQIQDEGRTLKIFYWNP
jgi:hypothetical protein